MPQIFDTPWEEATVTTNASTDNLAIALVFAPGTRGVRYHSVTNALKHAYDGTDATAIGSHFMLHVAGARSDEVKARSVMSNDSQRGAGYMTFAGNPTDGDTITFDDGSNTAVVFEFDNDASYTGTQVAINATLATTVSNFVTAFNAATLNAKASVHFDNTARVDWITTTAPTGAVKMTVTSSLTAATKPALFRLTDMGRRDIQYIGGTKNTTVYIQTQGEDD